MLQQYRADPNIASKEGSFCVMACIVAMAIAGFGEEFSLASIRIAVIIC